MRQPQRERLLRILRTQSQSHNTRRMRGVMRVLLEEAGMTVVMQNKQLFARKGSAAHVPYIVAHADTVHKIVGSDKYFATFDMMDGEIVHHAYDPSTNKPRGIGGDDKCGLWMAQEIARNMDNVGVIITVDEEVGCLGARRVTKEQLADATVLIQGDRRGHDDAVTRASGINISSDDWQSHVKKHIEDHGYRFCTFGAGTDVAAMHDTKAAEVSAINLSAAYYNPHFDNEYIREDKLENAFELALRLAEVSSDEKWGHVAQRHQYNYNQQSRTYNYERPLFSSWFGNDPSALSRGFHATHLHRDSIKNQPDMKVWKYDNQHRLYLTEDRTQCMFYLCGGLVHMMWGELVNAVHLIKESGYVLPDKMQRIGGDRIEVNWFAEYFKDRVASKMTFADALPTCQLHEGCNKPCRTFHMARLRWGCEEHMGETMKVDGIEFLTNLPAKPAIELPARNGVDSTNHWHYNAY